MSIENPQQDLPIIKTEEKSEKLPKPIVAFFIHTDPEIYSAETAFASIKNRGHNVYSEEVSDIFTKIDWSEKLKPYYKIGYFSVDSLFNDKNTHTYLEIINKAKELGLNLVPQSFVPSISSQAREHIFGYDYHDINALVATEVIHDSDGRTGLFEWNFGFVGSLRFYTNGAVGQWEPYQKFFFVIE
jgi:hypothetical protein